MRRRLRIEGARVCLVERVTKCCVWEGTSIQAGESVCVRENTSVGVGGGGVEGPVPA